MRARHFLFGMILLGAFVPGIARADLAPAGSIDKNGQSDGKSHDHTTNADRHDDKGHLRDDHRDHSGVAGHRHDKDRGASAAAHNGVSRQTSKEHHASTANRTGRGIRGMATAGLMPGLMPRTDRSDTGLPVSGNAVARHTAVQVGMGGPTTFDPKKHELVIIGGTAMVRGRRS